MSPYIPGALSAADILRPVVYCVTVNNEGDATNRQMVARIDKLINSDL